MPERVKEEDHLGSILGSSVAPRPEPVEAPENDEEDEALPDPQEGEDDGSDGDSGDDLAERLAQLERERDGIRNDLFSKRRDNRELKEKVDRLTQLIEAQTQSQDPEPTLDDDPAEYFSRQYTKLADEVGKINERLASQSEEQRIAAAGMVLQNKITSELGGDRERISDWEKRFTHVARAYQEQFLDQGMSEAEAAKAVHVLAIQYGNQAMQQGQNFTELVDNVYSQLTGAQQAPRKPAKSDAESVRRGVKSSPLSSSSRGGSGDRRVRATSREDWQSMPGDVKDKLLHPDYRGLWERWQKAGPEGLTISDIRAAKKS